ncbi:MAG: Stk1 family PASTA domain-containing Ser/Thr kinase [Micromonosporaceae bacterium]
MDTQVADPLNGALVGGRYRVHSRVARGGMSIVYHAVDERLGRTVALKVIQPGHANDDRFRRHLAEEAQAVARLTHPNVVAVYDEGVHDGLPYLVMEFVRGRTLRDILNERRRLDPVESLAVLEQVLAALAAAHRAGMVHRDVKPENVLIAPPPNGSGDLIDAVVKVADFGLAGAAEAANTTGQLLATAAYVAPELVREGRADPRADVYSAGIMLFEMLTGRVPFEGDRAADVAWQHVDRDVPPPSRVVAELPRLLDELVLRATRRDPDARPMDAAALLTQVQVARDDLGALAGPTRAIAHPTVVVAPVDRRPPWARLPAGRARGAATPVAPGHRRGTNASGLRSLAGAWGSMADRVARMPATRRGQHQLIAVAVVLALLLGVGGWWLGFGRYTTAPSLVNLTRDSATAEATRLGFAVREGPGIFDEHVAKGTVMRQHPDAGGRVVKHGTITLQLSLGPERYAVPEVAGQAAEFAIAELGKYFVVQQVDGFSDTLPTNYVVGTDPAAGTPLPPNSPVKVIIARGPFPVHVPGVIGKQLAEAQATLEGQGFTVEVQRQDDQSHPRDQVIQQNPGEGEGLASANGVKVVLVVANGPPGVPMPAVVSASCNDGRNQLQAMGLQVQVNGDFLAQQFGHVSAQDPQPGTPVQPGQGVVITCNL